MKSIWWIKNNAENAIVQVSLGVITLHLVIASLFAYDGDLAERQALATMALIVGGLTASYYASLARPLRGLIAVAYGFPALATGIGIHLMHTIQLGPHHTDFTGLPMFVAGLALFLTGVTILVRLIHTWWRRLLLVPAAPFLVFFVLFPVTFVVAITNVARPDVCCDDTPSDHGFAYEDVSFQNAAGLTIAGWYVPSANGAAIVTVHGSGSNRVNTIDEAMVLARHGYGVLMIDVEGFGESEGRSNSFGWLGARDVHAAVDYLQSRPDVDPQRIGGLGLSMGGEVMIQAIGENPSLRAIVAEGASGRTRDDFDEMPGYELAEGFHWMVGAVTLITTGVHSPPPLTQMIQQIDGRDALLISANIEEERHLQDLYQELGGPSVQRWEIPEADHVGALDNHPQEYEERVIAFFDEALLGGAAAVSARD